MSDNRLFRGIPHPLKPALYLQLLYTGLVVVWQLVGLVLLSMGQLALGPTASLSVAVQALAIAAFCIWALRGSFPLLFVLACVGPATAGGATIVRAFTAAPELWPSDEIRYLGVAVNVVGVTTLPTALVQYFRWKSSHDS